jgi:hypothetical protein
MKIAIVSESPADEAVLKSLVDALMNRKNDFVSSGRIRPGGWSAAIAAIEVELKSLHYNSDAHALVAVVDSNGSPVHDESHALSEDARRDCRVCTIRNHVDRVGGSLRPRAVNYPVQVVIGLAVPAIEAWLLCGQDQHVVEARFERERAAGSDLKNERVRLKRQLYGTEFPSLAKETEIATAAATRLCADLQQLERHFPKGFGSFAQALRML